MYSPNNYADVLAGLYLEPDNLSLATLNYRSRVSTGEATLQPSGCPRLDHAEPGTGPTPQERQHRGDPPVRLRLLDQPSSAKVEFTCFHSPSPDLTATARLLRVKEVSSAARPSTDYQVVRRNQVLTGGRARCGMPDT
jgi:hypothetical protein